MWFYQMNIQGLYEKINQLIKQLINYLQVANSLLTNCEFFSQKIPHILCNQISTTLFTQTLAFTCLCPELNYCSLCPPTLFT
jgi:hypothetical protein